MREFYTGEDVEEDDSGEGGLRLQLQHFYTSDQHERVISIGCELLALDPTEAWVHDLVGQAYVSFEDYNAAEKHLLAALSNAPESADVYSSLAWLEMSRGRYGKSDEYIRRAIQLDPTDVDAWHALGILCVHYEDFRQAQVCVNQIRQLDPESPLADALDVQSRSSIDGEERYDLDEKIEEFTRLLENDPENAYTHYELANIFLHQSADSEKAEFHFRKALKIDPRDRDYQRGLIKVWREKDLILRLLWIPHFPIKLAELIFHRSNQLIWPYLIIIALIKYVLLLLIVVGVIFYAAFWPVTKFYEYFTLAEVHRKMGVLKMYNGLTEKVHKWKYSKRLTVFIVITLGYWGLIFYFSPHIVEGVKLERKVVLITASIFALFIAFSWIYIPCAVILKKRKIQKEKPQDSTI